MRSYNSCKRTKNSLFNRWAGWSKPVCTRAGAKTSESRSDCCNFAVPSRSDLLHLTALDEPIQHLVYFHSEGENKIQVHLKFKITKIHILNCSEAFYSLLKSILTLETDILPINHLKKKEWIPYIKNNFANNGTYFL